MQASCPGEGLGHDVAQVPRALQDVEAATGAAGCARLSALQALNPVRLAV